jgi:undecaprenyl diphosphate synthase
MGEDSIRPEAIPRHIAVIMDGNGRWAEERGLARTDGHHAGVDAVRKIVRAARDLGVSWLTLFAFSSENWNRPKLEVDELMKLPEEFFESELPDAIENGIRIQMIGNRDRLPAHVLATLDEAIEATRGNSSMRLTFALSYGGRGEIVAAARRLLEDHVTDLMWPDFDRQDLVAAILDYQSRERRYGRISAQVRGEGGSAP